MPEEYMPLEPGRNSVVILRRGLATVAAKCIACKVEFDYVTPLDDYDAGRIEICNSCKPYISVEFSPELWP
jgi:hypothetical protein